MTEATGEGRKTPWQAIVLALLFFGPPLAAWLLYFHSDWRPGEMAVHGDLIDPAVPLPELVGPAGADPFRGHWSLLYIRPAATTAGRPCIACARPMWRWAGAGRGSKP